MPAERAGYTVTMFLVDVSPSMGQTRTIELPFGPNGEARARKTTRLEYVLEFVLLKVQEMIFHGRKTDQCGVVLFGTQGTKNVVNTKNGGYEHVTEFISIGQPNAQTMMKIKSIKPSTVIGDPIDAVIVGIETQAQYLAKKPTWTRKMVLMTDGENPMEIEDWELTVSKLNDLDVQMTIIGIDFDDEEMPFYEKDKPAIKRENEIFYGKFSQGLKGCVMGNAAFALQECSKPDIKMTKSALLNSKLRIGDVDTRPEQAIELHVKTAKCTATSKPPSTKKFAKRSLDAMEVDNDDPVDVFAQLKMKSQYRVLRDAVGEAEDDDDAQSATEAEGETVELEDLVRGYKYGASFVPVDPEEGFERLGTKAGIDICGFFDARNYRRDWSMSEVQYVFADRNSAREQIAFSSIVQAMSEKQSMAIARWVSRDGSDPKIGVMLPRVLDSVDCLLWVQVPFADDLRKFTFRSLERLVSKKGEDITKHAHLPTKDQLQAMDKFVDAMDLMHAGGKDDNGDRLPWFDTVEAYNPAVHRLKQALFHGAITSDLSENPLPPAHPELTKYFNPPPKVFKRAHDSIEECKSIFKVKRAPPRAVKRRKDGHVAGEDEDVLDLGAPVPKPERPVPRSTLPNKASPNKTSKMDVDSATEDESDEDGFMPVKKALLVQSTNTTLLANKSPTPDQSRSHADTALQAPVRLPIASASPPPDSGRAPGRIIGNTAPLEDFNQNIKEGDVVSQAVRDLGKVIMEVIRKPFSSRRHEEMLLCLAEMRQVALQEDEIATWNAFLRGLKDACLHQTPTNQEFWAEIQKIGRPMSLISSKEAKKLGGKSDVTEGTAVDFVEEEEE